MIQNTKDSKHKIGLNWTEIRLKKKTKQSLQKSAADFDDKIILMDAADELFSRVFTELQYSNNGGPQQKLI